MSNLERALEIAVEAHAGQHDKTGGPYIEHCQRVVDGVETLDQKIVGFLHDVLEKSSGYSLRTLRDEGFSPRIVEAVNAMTQRKGEEYFVFVRRAAANTLARPVKKADLEDNLWQMRQIDGPTDKYEEALRILREVSGS